MKMKASYYTLLIAMDMVGLPYIHEALDNAAF
jgi:hypothetical protein